MNRRLIGLLLALVLAGVATFFLVQYVRSADERAREEEQLAQVFRAQADIPAGTSAEDAMNQALIDSDQVPSRIVPPGAIATLDQISGQVATGPIGQGEIIVSQRFGSTVAQVDGGLDIPEGLQAVSVAADVIPGVAGFVQPGDTVSLLATIASAAPTEDVDDDEEAAAAPASGERTQYLIQNVVVLAVGQRVVTQEAGQTTFSTQLSNDQYIFTLGMEPADIEKAVFTTQQGNLWFTLVPEDQEPATTPGRTLDNVLD